MMYLFYSLCRGVVNPVSFDTWNVYSNGICCKETFSFHASCSGKELLHTVVILLRGVIVIVM